MPPDETNLAYLWDMYNAAREIPEFTAGLNLNSFARNKLIRYAVERQIMVIGEAAKNISVKFKEAHPEFPWRSIIAQRNVIAHEYGEILVERIWIVATESVPELLVLLEPFIPDDLNLGK